MTIVRLGLGQTSSGKILDKQTHWYVLENDKNELLNEPINELINELIKVWENQLISFQ